MHDRQIITIGVFSLIASALIFTMVGGMKEKYINSASSSVVTWVPTTAPSMHMFADNKCSPACCDQSNYSCSGGCVCMSEAQRMALSTRGNNASYRDALSG